MLSIVLPVLSSVLGYVLLTIGILFAFILSFIICYCFNYMFYEIRLRRRGTKPMPGMNNQQSNNSCRDAEISIHNIHSVNE
jgi:uncharacterized membrane protein YraQ (UPF0718 family)